EALDSPAPSRYNCGSHDSDHDCSLAGPRGNSPRDRRTPPVSPDHRARVSCDCRILVQDSSSPEHSIYDDSPCFSSRPRTTKRTTWGRAPRASHRAKRGPPLNAVPQLSPTTPSSPNPRLNSVNTRLRQLSPHGIKDQSRAVRGSRIFASLVSHPASITTEH